MLLATEKEKSKLIAGVTKDLIDKGFHAGKLIKEVATTVVVAVAAVQIWLKQVVKDPEK